jgi:hypothetical protein
VSPEAKWRIAWLTWFSVGIIVEIVAVQQPGHATLSHHLRQNTHKLGKTHLGRVALFAGAAWLHRHLYRPLLEEARNEASFRDDQRGDPA